VRLVQVDGSCRWIPPSGSGYQPGRPLHRVAKPASGSVEPTGRTPRARSFDRRGGHLAGGRRRELPPPPAEVGDEGHPRPRRGLVRPSTRGARRKTHPPDEVNAPAGATGCRRRERLSRNATRALRLAAPALLLSTGMIVAVHVTAGGPRTFGSVPGPRTPSPGPAPGRADRSQGPCGVVPTRRRATGPSTMAATGLTCSRISGGRRPGWTGQPRDALGDASPRGWCRGRPITAGPVIRRWAS